MQGHAHNQSAVSFLIAGTQSIYAERFFKHNYRKGSLLSRGLHVSIFMKSMYKIYVYKTEPIC